MGTFLLTMFIAFCGLIRFEVVLGLIFELFDVVWEELLVIDELV